MRVKTVGWFVGSLGLLVGAGTAWGNEEGSASTGSDMPTKTAGMGECKDAGVTVAFKTGSAELDQNARGALDGVATWLKADEKRTLKLEGFADTTGDSEANLVLSAKRAEAVKSYLIEHGVSSPNVMTVGRGEEADHLPANGRAVTFLACVAAVAPTVAEEVAPTPPETLEPPPPEPAPVAVIPPPAAPKQYGSTFGFAFMAGGSYQDFTNNTMQNATTGAGGWSARFIGGTNSIIGFEAAYLGAANQIQNLGVTANNNNTYLVQNGLEGTARLNVPLRKGYHLFEPYGYVGLGYARYSITNYNQNVQRLSSFTSNDDTMTVPVGGGIAYAYKGFMIDARAGWTASYYENLLNTAVNSSGTLDHWNVGGQIGYRF